MKTFGSLHGRMPFLQSCRLLRSSGIVFFFVAILTTTFTSLRHSLDVLGGSLRAGGGSTSSSGRQLFFYQFQVDDASTSTTSTTTSLPSKVVILNEKNTEEKVVLSETPAAASGRTYFNMKFNQTMPDIIPKHLHLIYVSPDIFVDDQEEEETSNATTFTNTSVSSSSYIPADVFRHVSIWKKNQPIEWNVTLWDNALVRQHYSHVLFPTLAVQEITQMALVSDILRYHILRDYGSIYLDTDIIPIRRLDPLVEELGGSFGLCEDPIHAPPASNSTGSNILLQDPSIPCTSFANGIIGVSSHHPAVYDAVQQSWTNTLHYIQRKRKNTNGGVLSRRSPHHPNTILSTTGPKLWTPIVLRHNLLQLRGYTFLPCTMGNLGNTEKRGCNVKQLRKHDPTVFGVHGYSGSWRKATIIRGPISNTKQQRK